MYPPVNYSPYKIFVSLRLRACLRKDSFGTWNSCAMWNSFVTWNGFCVNNNNNDTWNRTFGQMIVILLSLLLLGSFSSGSSAEENHDHDHDHDKGLDPYEGVLGLFNVSANVFGAETLQSIVEHFSERFECGQSGQTTGPVSTCPFSFVSSRFNILITRA